MTTHPGHVDLPIPYLLPAHFLVNDRQTWNEWREPGEPFDHLTKEERALREWVRRFRLAV